MSTRIANISHFPGTLRDRIGDRLEQPAANASRMSPEVAAVRASPRDMSMGAAARRRVDTAGTPPGRHARRAARTVADVSVSGATPSPLHRLVAIDDRIDSLSTQSPRPGEVAKRAAETYLEEHAPNAVHNDALDKNWASNVYLRVWKGGGDDQYHAEIMPVADLGWLPVVEKDGNLRPDVAAKDFDVIHIDPDTYAVTIPEALNGNELKNGLIEDIYPKIIDEYKSAQTAYWSATENGKTRDEALVQELRDGLLQEVEMRSAAQSISPAAVEVLNKVMQGGEGTLSSSAATAHVGRLTVDGTALPGTFVLAESTGHSAAGPLLLWRPGRPVQEFPTQEALKEWVAQERGVDTGAIDIPEADGNVFDLRAQDFHTQNEAAVVATFKSPRNQQSLTGHLDAAVDEQSAAYLTLGPARRGLSTERYRSHITESKGDPATSLRLEALEESVERSNEDLAMALGGIPSLDEFTDERVQHYCFANYNSDKVDPVNTVVHATVSKYYAPTLLDPDGHWEPQREYTTTLREVVQKNADTSHEERDTATRMNATLINDRGGLMLDSNGNAVTLNQDAIRKMATDLDVGENYTKLLSQELSPDAETVRTFDRKALWMRANENKMRLGRLQSEIDPAAGHTFSSPANLIAGGLGDVDNVLAHPDPSTRPNVDGRAVQTYYLTLGAQNASGGGGQPLHGVAVIGDENAADGGRSTLYTPDAPDGIAFREIESPHAAMALFRQPSWKRYASDRMSIRNPEEIERILEKSGAFAGMPVLKKMEGDMHAAMYKQSLGFAISEAKANTLSNEQAKRLALFNHSMTGVELALELADLIPGRKVGSVISKTARRLASARKRLRGFAQRPAQMMGTLRDSAFTWPGTPGRSAAPTTIAPDGSQTAVPLPEPKLAGTPQWRKWALDDDAVQTRLVEGNRGPGGSTYRRDPVTGKEYMKIDGAYYRGEYRGGDHVIFNEGDATYTRRVESLGGSMIILPHEGVLMGGAPVPVDIGKAMDGFKPLQSRSPVFREAYYLDLQRRGHDDVQIQDMLTALGNKSKNAIHQGPHNIAMKAGVAASGPAVKPKKPYMELEWPSNRVLDFSGTGATRAGVGNATIAIERNSLQHALKHAGDFGVNTSIGGTSAEAEFGTAIFNHLKDPNTVVIPGQYHGNPVTHYYNMATRVGVIKDANGNFVSGWKMSLAQQQHLLTNGKLGGTGS